MAESLSPWLALREAADHAARSQALTDLVAAQLPREAPHRIVDLGTGTGSNVRYLAPRLPRPQQWLLVDRDATLLAEAAERLRRLEAIDVETHEMNLGDLVSAGSERTRPARDPIGGRHLVTASALLDLVSKTWLEALAAQIRDAGACALFALTYDGRSGCQPEEPEDEWIRELLNHHQRQNDKGFGLAAGPDAAGVAQRAFAAVGYTCRVEASDWMLRAESKELQRQLIAGWADAAREMAPDRIELVDDWLRRRVAHVAAARSRITVGHQDLAAWRVR